jgi:hypothetical protein
MSWFPEHTIESAPAGSRRFMVATQNHLALRPWTTSSAHSPGPRRRPNTGAAEGGAGEGWRGRAGRDGDGRTGGAGRGRADGRTGRGRADNRASWTGLRAPAG